MTYNVLNLTHISQYVIDTVVEHITLLLQTPPLVTSAQPLITLLILMLMVMMMAVISFHCQLNRSTGLTVVTRFTAPLTTLPRFATLI